MAGFQRRSVPVQELVELARLAKALDDPWTLRVLRAFAMNDDPGLARALVLKLRARAVAEMICPFPFDVPTAEDFID